MNKPTIASGLLGAIALVAALGCAQPTLAAYLVDVSVVNRNTGERLTPYRHDGKLYVAGTPGDPYFMELRSKRERVLTVVSVDGVNVLTGQTAALLQSGYVIDARQSYGISGWRKTMSDVAQFVFTALPDSYAARTGRPGNVGVIGVAVYRERYVPPPAVLPAPRSPLVEPGARQKSNEDAARDASGALAPQGASAPAEKTEGESPRRSEAATAGALAGQRADQPESRPAAREKDRAELKKLGTGHGEREYSPTRYTEFVRSSDTPDEIITVYYDSRANLVARGIIPSARLADPTPFPAGAGFVPDPRG
jgi:hypothetical protein